MEREREREEGGGDVSIFWVVFEGKGNEQRRGRMWGGGGAGGREYLSESLTDYLYTYILTSMCVCMHICDRMFCLLFFMWLWVFMHNNSNFLEAYLALCFQMFLSKYVWVIIYIHIWCLFLLFCVSNRQWYPGKAVKPLHRRHLGDGPVEHATNPGWLCSDYPTKSKTYSCHSA